MIIVSFFFYCFIYYCILFILFCFVLHIIVVVVVFILFCFFSIALTEYKTTANLCDLRLPISMKKSSSTRQSSPYFPLYLLSDCFFKAETQPPCLGSCKFALPKTSAYKYRILLILCFKTHQIY